jgi:dTDP-4-dehydrorhamnose 3,5-epimerase
MIVETTTLPGVLVVRSPVHCDARGFFIEIFRADRFQAIGLPIDFVQDNHSRSRRHVLRGLHFQLDEPQGKLVRPMSGTIFDVAVDVRRSSAAFGRWVGVTLEAGDGRQLWIPPGFAHGFLVLSDSSDVSYKCTSVHQPTTNRSVRWNDPDLGIAWPLPPGVAPNLSDADARAGPFSSAECFE